MAKKDLPFDEDMMTLIMGVGGPNEPGQHGRTNAPMPTEDATSLIIQIRDLCDDFLMKSGKEDEDKKESKDTKNDTEDMDIDMEEE